MVRDVGLAEELAQEALLAALEKWPETGVPDNPGAWLMAAAKNRALDHFRDRLAAIGGDGVHVDVALDVSERNELRQSICSGGFNFAAVLAQLGFDVGQAELGVDLFFGCAGNALVRVEPREAILIEREAKLERALA